jgi:hypothetical protein
VRPLIVSREEITTLETLAEGVTDKIWDLSKTRRFPGKIDNTQLALHEHNYAQLKAYEELAHACYGRTVLGLEVDENEGPKGSFVYRITQANVGYIGKSCSIIARNSPLATELVTALPGDSRDVVTKAKERYFNVGEVRTFDGPVSLLSRAQQPNFRSATVRKAGAHKPKILRDLRSIVYSLSTKVTTEITAGSSVPKVAPDATNIDPAWLADWSSVYLPDTDESSLGH